MRVVVYPADSHGCGHHRMIWPAEQLADAGHDVHVVRQEDRSVEFTVSGDRVVDARIEDADVVVFQRVTHKYLTQAVSVLQSKGIAVVIDIDDDLTSIHPNNPAWDRLHPRHYGRMRKDGTRHMHSWKHLTEACKHATLVTATTQALITKYARHGRGVVLPNYLASHYFDVEHTDSTSIVWPASLHSHPDDPTVVGTAIARLVGEGVSFASYGDAENTASVFKILDQLYEKRSGVSLVDWPAEIARHGIGIAPLTDTTFNHSKSWLKPLEMSAVGVPWVASPTPEYNKLHRLGVGLIADKPRHWYRELNQLVNDERLRKELSDAGRDVANQFRLEDHAWRWAEAWDNALRIQQSGSGDRGV